MSLIYIITLPRSAYLGQNAKFLLPLTNSKWSPRVDLGGHHFIVLNCAINNTPDFVSAVVIFENISKNQISLKLPDFPLSVTLSLKIYNLEIDLPVSLYT